MPESSNAGPLASLPAWFGGKLLGAIFRGNRTTNEAGIAAFRDRARTTLNPPPKPAPPASTPHQVDYSPQGFPSSGKPGPSKRGKVKPKKRRRRGILDLWRDMPEGLRNQVFAAYSDALMGGLAGAGRTGARSAYRAPPFGSKSAQRGFVGRVASGPGAAAREITNAARRSTSGTANAAAARARIASEFDPKWGEELEPAIAPIKVPKRVKVSDLDLIEVPQRQKYGDLEKVSVPQRTKYGSGAANRRATAPVGNGRSPGTARLPGTVARTGIPGLPGTGAGSLSLHFGPLTVPLEPILRALTTRKPAQRPGKASFAQPGASPKPEPFPEFNPPTVGSRTSNNTCDCPTKNKKSKPRKDRSECRQGTYVQTRRGVKYRPNKIVPCT